MYSCAKTAPVYPCTPVQATEPEAVGGHEYLTEQSAEAPHRRYLRRARAGGSVEVLLDEGVLATEYGDLCSLIQAGQMGSCWDKVIKDAGMGCIAVATGRLLTPEGDPVSLRRQSNPAGDQKASLTGPCLCIPVCR